MTTARNLTAVLIVYLKNRINHRLRFGIPILESRLDWRRKASAFTAGATFGYIRWRANRYGTQDWRFFVIQTVADGPITAVPGVIPGGVLLLATRGRTRTARALSVVDALEKEAGNLENISPAYWRHLANRLAVGMGAHGISPMQTMSFEGNCP